MTGTPIHGLPRTATTLVAPSVSRRAATAPAFKLTPWPSCAGRVWAPGRADWADLAQGPSALASSASASLAPGLMRSFMPQASIRRRTGVEGDRTVKDADRCRRYSRAGYYRERRGAHHLYLGQVQD